MPRDSDGQWRPEAHRAESYTEAQRAAGGKALSDFGRAASGAAPGLPDHSAPMTPAAATIITIALTPLGQTHLAANAPARARARAASKLAARLTEESHADVHRDWLRRDLTKEFKNAREHVNSRELDLER